MENNFLNRDSKVIDVTSSTTFMTRVYQWMFIGVLLTGLVAMVVAQDSELMRTMVMGPMRFVFFIAQIGLVIGLGGFINKISSTTALIMFLVYSVLTGMTLSILAYAYTMASIQSAFLTTSLSFGALSIFGHVTKKDLSGVGTFCSMALIGIVVFSLISMFIPSMRTEGMSTILNIGILLVFAGLTAYDTQKIKAIGQYSQSGEMASKMAVVGALTLYLDFINMFIAILNLTGNRRK